MIIAKKHLTQGKRRILAVCDEELFGKNLEEGKRHLDLCADFYRGETITLMKKAFSINAAGKNLSGAASCCGY